MNQITTTVENETIAALIAIANMATDSAGCDLTDLHDILRSIRAIADDTATAAQRSLAQLQNAGCDSILRRPEVSSAIEAARVPATFEGV